MAKNINKKGVAKATKADCVLVNSEERIVNNEVQEPCTPLAEQVQVLCRVLQHGVIIGRGCYRRGVTLSLPVETARALETCGKVRILGCA